ncbi:MAG: GDP-L-fucose synthase [Burkholderiales bacterium]|nr:GDP-L-fucose synthase [Burkholderiales bacterium]
MDKNSKIYVAGHHGLVGSALVRCLQQQGYLNLILCTHSELELTNQQAVANFFKDVQPDYVFLAAAKVGGIYANNTYRADFIYQNLQIQNNIIHNSYLNKVKKLLFLGSSCIYPKNATQPMVESSLLTGELEYTNEPYAIAKIAGIKMCESYNLQYRTNYIAVMPTNLYGPNDNFDLENSHVLPAMIRKLYLAKLLHEGRYSEIAKNLGIVCGEDNKTDITHAIVYALAKYGIVMVQNSNGGESQIIVKLWGSGTPYREFLHVDDMADACVFIMQNINFTDLVANYAQVKNTHINVGTGQDLTIKDLAYLIKDQIGFNGQILFDTTKPDGTMKKLQDVTKLTALGWKYKIPLNEGIKNTIEFYLQQHE